MEFEETLKRFVNGAKMSCEAAESVEYAVL